MHVWVMYRWLTHSPTFSFHHDFWLIEDFLWFSRFLVIYPKLIVLECRKIVGNSSRNIAKMTFSVKSWQFRRKIRTLVRLDNFRTRVYVGNSPSKIVIFETNGPGRTVSKWANNAILSQKGHFRSKLSFLRQLENNRSFVVVYDWFTFSIYENRRLNGCFQLELYIFIHI